MNKLFIVVSLFIITGCTDSNNKIGEDTTKTRYTKDSISKRKAIDSMMRLGDSEPDDTPTQEQERERRAKTYDQIEMLDSTFISKNDTLKFHLKYYCLKNSTLILPVSYNEDITDKKPFITYEFSAEISMVHNKDTVLNRLFRAKDLNPFFTDNFGGSLKKYGSLMMPSFGRRNIDKSRIVIDYPIAIPATDIGLGMFLIISKNGDYTFAEQY